MSTQLELPSATDLSAGPAPEPAGLRTRSGRVSKPPVRYEPVEQVEDDYASDEYDEAESDVSSHVAFSESEIEDDEDDSDLDDFIVEDKSESGEDNNGSESDSDSAAGGVRAPVARGTPAPAKVPVSRRGAPAAVTKKK